MEGGGPERDRAERRVGRGLTIYAGALFAISLLAALFGPYPFSVVAWGVALVSAAFIALFIVIPAMRGR